ncbi:hypothetical protein V2J09_016038 [Rumex salicifolius]
MDGNNGIDNAEAEPVVDDSPPVPEPPEDDHSFTPPPLLASEDQSASLPLVVETERNGEAGSKAVDDRSSRPEAEFPLPMPVPPVGSRFPSHHPGADRPPVHPPPAALRNRSEPIPIALDDHAIPNGTARSISRSSSVGHRRTQSEVVFREPKPTNSFQNFKSQIQRAWKWAGSPPEENRNFSFNPEVLANQKRQWYQLQSKSLDRTKYEEPTELFEHLIVTGLPPHANLEAIEQAFARKKKWELAMARTVLVEGDHEYWFPPPPSLEPQMLFKYPPGKRLPMRSKDLCAFCFPGGVKASMVERTPSLSDLNELVYGQGHLERDDTAFIFSLKVADNASLYGVCLLVPEIVQRSPGILGGSSSFCRPAASRFLVSAPRCYCLLTRVPFFELHFEMLKSIVSQERLNRITQFVSEINGIHHIPSTMRSSDQLNVVAGSPSRDPFTDWMSSAIPIDSAVLLSASAAGIEPVNEVSSSSINSEETWSLPSATASETFSGRAKETNNGYLASDAVQKPNIVRSSSSISLFSSARSLEEEGDTYLSSNEIDFSDEFMRMEQEKESRNDFIKIVNGYLALPVPARGSEIVFQPLEHLHTIQYRRPVVSDFDVAADLLELEDQNSSALAEVSAKLATAEEVAALSIWTIATMCRAVSLDNILALITGVLLEKQVVVTCPNLGVLSAIVLSIIPIIQPFEWQSLLLPILPEKLLDFLDAPVPFLVGVKHKPVDLLLRTNNIVYIDVFKGQRKMCNLPFLPKHNMLLGRLRRIHARLGCEKSIAQRQHVYRYNETQAKAAMEFRDVMRSYMESLCAEIRLNTITSVQSNDDRVSILLKDSFIDSFSEIDQPFMKQFVETQMFSVLSDSRLSRFEHE